MDVSFTISRDVDKLKMQTDFGLVVAHDLGGSVTIRVPSGYKKHLCGLCGNYDGDTSNDMRNPSNENLDTVEKWSNSWLIAGQNASK